MLIIFQKIQCLALWMKCNGNTWEPQTRAGTSDTSHILYLSRDVANVKKIQRRHVKCRPWWKVLSLQILSTLTKLKPSLIHTWCICSLRIKWHLYIIVEVGNGKKKKSETSVSTIFKWRLYCPSFHLSAKTVVIETSSVLWLATLLWLSWLLSSWQG